MRAGADIIEKAFTRRSFLTPWNLANFKITVRNEAMVDALWICNYNVSVLFVSITISAVIDYYIFA